LGKINANSDRKVKEAARRGAYGLGVVEIDRIATDQNSIGSEGVGAPDHRAEVAWIADLITQHSESKLARQGLIGLDVDHLADRDHTLWGHGVGQLSDGPSRGYSNLSPNTERSVEEIAVPADTVVGHDQP
jgi:hypothetical protein